MACFAYDRISKLAIQYTGKRTVLDRPCSKAKRTEDVNTTGTIGDEVQQIAIGRE